MAGFNPDQYLAEKVTAPVSGGGGFNPDAYLSEKEAPKPATPEISKKESFARGAAQGASMGFSDEITGGLEAMWEKAKGNPVEFGNLYKQYRDESRKNYDDAKKANPGTYTTGEIGAGVATAFVPGMAIAKGAKLANVVGKSAMIGGAAGVGNSEKENIDDVVIDGVKGAAIGGALGGVATVAAPYVGKLANKAGEKMKGSAERYAARALGAERATVKKIGADKIQEVGRHALDEGILSPLASTDDMIARNEAVKASGAGKMKEVYNQIDEAGASNFNPLEVATKVEDKIGGFYRSPINKGETNQLENTLESILMRSDKSGAKNIPLKAAQELKQELGKVANWKNNLNITDKEQMARDAYKVVSSAIDDAAESGAKSIGKDGLEETLKAGKALYSKSKSAEELLNNKHAREQGNKLLGITDWSLLGGGAAGGLVTGGASVLPTMAAVAAKKGLERFGSQNAALLLDKTGKALVGSPKIAEAISRNPNLVNMTAGDKVRSMIPAPSLKAAENDAPKKGPEKWANDGLEKLKAHDPEILNRVPASALKDPKAKELLIKASDLKPGSKAMTDILERIEKAYGASSSRY